MIYIDPPYGKDDLGQFADTNYHNAITRDNLLSMLYPRLQLAKQLLREDGVIFCSIDDRNQAYVKCLFDEVFGEGNFVANLCVVDNLKGNNNTDGISTTNEYCLIYAKNIKFLKIGELQIEEDDDSLEKWNIDEFGYWKEGRNIKGTGENAPREKRPSMFYPIYLNDDLEISLEKSNEFYIEVLPLTNGKEMCWNWGKEFLKNNKHELIVKKTENGYNFIKKQRPSLGDLPSKKMKTTCYSPKYSTSVSSNTIKDIFNKSVFNYSKSIYFIKDLLKISTNSNNEESSLRGEAEASARSADPHLQIHNDTKQRFARCGEFANANARHEVEASRNDKGDSKAEAFQISNAQGRSENQSLQEKYEAEVSLRDFAGCQGGGEGVNKTLMTEADNADSRKSTKETTPKDEFAGDIVLDFFAGSGTTAHAVLELNREDGGNRKFILVTNNEITPLNPNGIAQDVTSKRLKRIMSGECYNGDKGFKWLEKNEPYGDNLQVCEIKSCHAFDENIFSKIDERLYGLAKFTNPNEKIKWVCENFESVMKKLVMSQKRDDENIELDEEGYEKALRKILRGENDSKCD